jgi:predicted alpha/beta superfamily hydrolase
MNEYTMPPQGKGDLYVKMITDEIKPMVDAALRTLTTRDQTALIGSSLGGLISAYAGVYRSDTFGLIGAMSPSTWWNSTQILGQVATIPQQPQRALKVYVDSGDSGPSNDDVTNTATLAQTYKTDGYVEGTTLHYVVQPGGQHNETYWAQRLPGGLAFLLGPGR